MKNALLKTLLMLYVISIILCGCSSTIDTTEKQANLSTPIESESDSSLTETTGCRIAEEDIVGDWHGVAESYSESETVLYSAILSINPDGQWASCVNGRINQGTWEIDPSSNSSVILTVRYTGITATNTWTFEKTENGKYCFNYVYHESIPIEVIKMENDSTERLLGDWEGKTFHTFEDGKEKEFSASLSINPDNSWSSSVNGSTNSGHWSYISDAGHLIVLTVEYNGGNLTNTWAFIKNSDGQYYYEYVYGERIPIPVVKPTQ